MTPENVLPKNHYLNEGFGWKSWLLTTDHKRIAWLYLVSITLMFFLGGFAAFLIRLQLLTPHGEILRNDTYNKMFTMHGVVMVFFFLIPSIPATLGNFLVPLMVGAKDLAFPKINLLSWYIYIIGAIYVMWIILSGGLETGWTFYTPYSTSYSTSNVVGATLGVFFLGFSSILTGLNFIVTIHKMRAPGLTWFRMPLMLWALYATSLIQVLATPVLAITMVLVAVERFAGVGIFDPALGGDPILYQHMFWFYSHPAVYIMILPSMGVISEVISCFSRKRVFGYKFVAISSLMIAVFGFLVWGHHMYVSGMSPFAGMTFSLISYLVAVPSAVKTFNWTATLYKGSVSYDTPMLYAIGFIGLFVVGGLTGLFLASMGLDQHLHDTYFVIAHFHFIMVGGAVMAYFAGIHFWWPKMTGRMYPEAWGRLSAMILFIGFILTFFPQFIVGYMGMPRRYSVYVPEFQTLNVLSTAGSTILAVGYVLPLIYLLWALKFGEIAAANPWRAKGLEWEAVPAIPAWDNFPVTPTVTEDAYNYPQRPMAEIEAERATGRRAEGPLPELASGD